MPNHIIVVVVETNDMNPLVGIRIPRGTLCRGLAIRVVRLSPTDRNRDAILKRHRESLVVGVVVEIDAWERIGDGRVLCRHGVYYTKLLSCCQAESRFERASCESVSQASHRVRGNIPCPTFPRSPQCSQTRKDICDAIADIPPM